MRRAWPLLGALALAGCGGRAAGPPAPGVEKQPHAVLLTGEGRIVARLNPRAAPKTVENFIALASGRKEWTDPKTGRPTRRPLYDGTVFHRVIPEFVIQGGSPDGSPSGGPGYSFGDEIVSSPGFDRPGLLAMANSGPDTNGSQFFITLGPAPWLDGKHAVFGEVVEGLRVAEAISRAPRGPRGEDRPLEPVVLRRVRIEYR